MYNYHDIFFYYAFGALNGGGGSIQVIGITEGTTSVTFESNGKPLITYRIYGSPSGVGDLNAETGKYDITVTCNEDTYTISLDAPLMDGEYIDYKTQRLYPSGLDVSMPEISTIEGTNTLTVITTNPSSKVYVECYRAKDIPLPVASTIIGSVPFEFQCYEAGNLMDYSISGNAVQDGTPSADAPVDATGCGVRTGNLLDFEQLKNAPSATIGYITFPHVLTLQLKANTYYTMASNGTGSTSSTPADLYRSAYFNSSTAESSVNKNNPVTVLTDDTGVVAIGFFSERTNSQQYLNGEAQLWINEGSEVLPYEPYGYKLPLTANGTEYPIYLGQVETTRRIKKLVLTGEETIPNNDGASYNSETSTDRFVRDILLSVGDNGTSKIILCTHLGFQAQSWAARTKTGCCIYCSGNTMQLHLRFDNTTLGITQSDTNEQRTEKLKAYLAAQYAAGTPVTVWYVLAEPETAVVNEPLMKIGDYADTINLSQTGIDIPVIKGNNVLTINTDVPPSETYIKYNGKEKEYGYYITSDGYIYTTSDGYKYGIRS